MGFSVLGIEHASQHPVDAIKHRNIRGYRLDILHEHVCNHTTAGHIN